MRTKSLTSEQMEARVARFNKLQTYQRHAPSLAKEIEDEYGKTALAGLQKIGFRFEDEPGA